MHVTRFVNALNGISRMGYMTGGHAARWQGEQLSDVLLGKAVDFVTAHKNVPIFLYHAGNEPHVPRAPHPRFAGKSGMGSRGDAILQLDWTVGELVRTLEALGIARDTLIVSAATMAQSFSTAIRIRRSSLPAATARRAPIAVGSTASWKAARACR